MENSTREPAVAGMFYPDNTQQCDRELTSLLEGNPNKASLPRPRALIVPHAGYIYSGSVAAQAYNLLCPYKNDIQRVLLLGPSHRVPLSGMAVSSAENFRTPLGSIPLDRNAIARIQGLPDVKEMDLAHQFEHSLEVQLPFLQKVLGAFSLIPIVVGDCAPESVADVLQLLWNSSDTLTIASSDLSHFLEYERACQLDKETSNAIERCDYHLTGEQACGCHAVNGVLFETKRAGNQVTCLALANSGDTAGDKSRVVGYGAYAIS